MKKTALNQLKIAFTLPEVIVAFSVLILVIMASTSVVVSVIRGNQENENTLAAYFLAQEALEGARNIRDSNWLLGADFQGNIESGCIWEACLPSTVGQKQYFTIDRKNNNFSTPGSVGSREIQQYAPWKLKNITINGQADESASRLFSFENGRLGHVSESVESGSAFSAALPGKFHRYLEITPKSYGDGALTTAKYQVFAVVTWIEGSRNKQIRLGTELTNWKGGGP